MVFSNCEWCGIEKGYPYPSTVKRFCSHQCSNEYKWTFRKRGEGKVINCKVCNKQFYILLSALRVRERKSKVSYCSTKCMGIGQKKATTRKCLMCSKEFESTRNRYCSKSCVAVGRTNKAKGKVDGYWFENGYKVIYQGKGQGRKEHLLVMEEHIGRKLRKHEVVHHINEDRSDNRIENLQLMTWSEHSKYHRNKELNGGKELFGR